MTSEVFNTDCLEYMRTLPDKAFQLAIADPPYGIGMDGGCIGYKGFNNFEKKEWDKNIPDIEFFKEMERVSVNQIYWGGNYFPLPPSRCWVIWDKGEGFYNRTYAEAELAWTSFDANVRIFKHDPLAKGDYHGKIHPTQKPVALYAWLLKNYAKPGDRIFDPMMGSQSSRIAAYKMGFDYVGCELDKEYFDKGCERFNRECKGEIVTKDGNIVKQMSLFDL